MTMMSKDRGNHRFRVECCGKRRGIFPGGVIVCSVCDYNHDNASVMPNENKAKDIPRDQRWWVVYPKGPA